MASLKNNILFLQSIPVIGLIIAGFVFYNITQTQDERLSQERVAFFKAQIENQNHIIHEHLKVLTSKWDFHGFVRKALEFETTRVDLDKYFTHSPAIDQIFILLPDDKIQSLITQNTTSDAFENALHELHEKRELTHHDGMDHDFSEWVRINSILYRVFIVPIILDGKEYEIATFHHMGNMFWRDFSQKFNLPLITKTEQKNRTIHIPFFNQKGEKIITLYMAGDEHILSSIFNKLALLALLIFLPMIGISTYAHRKNEDYRRAQKQLLDLNASMENTIKERTQELHTSLEETKKASAAKTSFLSSMSHELRTPLNGILGFAQLLKTSKKSSLSEKEIGWVDQIEEGGNHLLTLVNDILDLAQIESGRLELSMEDVHPKEVFKECFSMCKPLAEKKNITLSGVPNTTCKIHIDRRRLKQVLINLLSNAIKYNRDNGEVKFGCYNPEPNTVRLYVTDTGFGISEEDRDKIFEPFYRSKKVLNLVEGTGVGLPLVLRLVQSMGGKVDFETTKDTGTTFYLDFPVALECEIKQDT